MVYWITFDHISTKIALCETLLYKSYFTVLALAVHIQKLFHVSLFVYVIDLGNENVFNFQPLIYGIQSCSHK